MLGAWSKNEAVTLNIASGLFRCQCPTRVILKYAGTMAPMAPILLVVGEAKAELAQALVPCETGAVCK